MKTSIEPEAAEAINDFAGPKGLNVRVLFDAGFVRSEMARMVHTGHSVRTAEQLGTDS